jgi:hypothetical protein
VRLERVALNPTDELGVVLATNLETTIAAE